MQGGDECGVLHEDGHRGCMRWAGVGEPGRDAQVQRRGDKMGKSSVQSQSTGVMLSVMGKG